MAKKKHHAQHKTAPALFKDIQLTRQSDAEWQIPQQSPMRVPCHVFATDAVRATLDSATLRQACNVATLPGIVTASMVMPDAHSGYGFPIGGVAAFDPDAGGVICAGGVGFDIACGVRMLVTGLTPDDVLGKRTQLADALFRSIPCGVGTGGAIPLASVSLEAMLTGGAKWAVAQGYGTQADLDHTEEGGFMRGARPEFVSAEAKKRFMDQLGTLGSGNHYMEVQRVTDIYDATAAQAFGIAVDDILLSIHCGSRGLGHQIGTDFLPRMADKADYFGITLPEKELACAPIFSDLGQEYLGAMRAGINCALANRQVLTHLARGVFAECYPHSRLRMIYDVSHNTCKEEQHVVNGKKRLLHVHRKGATRAFGPGHPELPAFCRSVGQPVIVGGSMGTPSYILAGCTDSAKSFCSANHGAGRAMSRTTARKTIHGKDMLAVLDRMGITIRTSDMRSIAEEAPEAYKNINAVVEATEKAGLARRVARAVPLICIKG